MGKAITGALELAGAAVLDAVALLSTGGIAAAWQSVFWSLVASGIASEAGAIAQALGSNQGMGVTTRQPAGLRAIIRGTQRVGGTIVYLSTTGSTKRQYNMIIVLATHPCEAVENLYLDGRQVFWDTASNYNQTVNGVNFGGNAKNVTGTGPNGVQYNFGGLVFCAAFQGKQNTNPTVVSGTWVGPSTITDATVDYPGFCSALQANDPTWAPGGSDTPILAGCTYVYLKIEADGGTFPQFPEIRFTVRGKNDIYDPRTSTRGYTDNWALHIADAITDPTFGLGDNSVNQAQLIAAANVCDEQVQTMSALPAWQPFTSYTAGDIFTAPSPVNGSWLVVTDYTSGATWGSADTTNATSDPSAAIFESRYALHWHYDTSTSPGDAIQQMMTAAAGRLSRIGGEWYIWPAYWQGPSFTFDENALRADLQWSPKRSLSELFNRVTGTYIAPNFPYNIAGNLYDTNGYFQGQTQNNFPFGFQPTNYPMYAADVLHGYSEDVYLIADTPNLGAYNAANPYNAGDVIIYSGGLWQANEAVPAANPPGSLDGSGDPYWSPTGNYLPREIQQPCCLSIAQAQRVAKIYMMRNRQQGSGEIVMSLSAFQMQPLDVLEMNFTALGWTNKLLEIASDADFCMKLFQRQMDSADGDESQALETCIQLRVQETDPSVYDWAETEELTAYDVPVITGGENTFIVGAPTSLTLADNLSTALLRSDGSFQARVLLSWTEPVDTYVNNGGSIQIQWQDFAGVFQGGAWIDAGNVSGQATSTFFEVDSSVSAVNVQIRSVRPNGATSVWVPLTNQSTIIGGSATLAGTPTAPTAPGGTTTTQIATTAFVAAAVGGATPAPEFRTAPVALAAPTTSTTTYTVGNGSPVTLAHPADSFYFVDGVKMVYGTYYTISGTTLTILGTPPATGHAHELYGS